MAIVSMIAPSPKDDVRAITGSALRQRFTAEEEVSIVENGDALVRMRRERLYSMERIELDALETTVEITHILDFLVFDGALTYPLAERLAELLKDGSLMELYTR